MSMKPNVKKFAVIGAVAGAAGMCLYALLMLRFFPGGGTFVPKTSWLDVAFSTAFSTTSLVGAILGAVTGHALASSEEGEYDAAAKACLITGILAVMYNALAVSWNLFTGFRFAASNNIAVTEVISMYFLPTLASLMTSLTFLWGLFLLCIGIYLHQTKRRGTGVTAG
jgi:hypothetical protein